MNTTYQRQETTWYGLPAEIVVTERHLHRVRVLRLPLPHIGVVNWIVRRGLPLQTRLELTALHEFGHLQTLPVILPHLLVMLWPRQDRLPSPRWLRALLVFLTHQVAWEVVSESYVLAQDSRAYRSLPTRADRNRYVFFWGAMAIFSVISTWFVLRRMP